MTDLIDAETMAMAKEYDDEHANDSRELDFMNDPAQVAQEQVDDEGEDKKPEDENEPGSGDEDEGTENNDGDDGERETMSVTDLVDAQDDDNDDEGDDENEDEDIQIEPVYVNGVDISDTIRGNVEKMDGIDRYLYSHIAPAVLTDDNGKQIAVYSVDAIPKGFKFGNQSDETRAEHDFTRIGQEVTRYNKLYQDQQADKQALEAQQAESEADLADIADLQDEGLIPYFVKADTVDDMVDDPAAQLTDMVLTLKEEMNDNYASRGINRSVGVREAYNEFMRENPEIEDAIAKDREESDPQHQEDVERREIAGRTVSGRTVSTAARSSQPKSKEPAGLRTVQQWADWASTVNPNEL